MTRRKRREVDLAGLLPGKGSWKPRCSPRLSHSAGINLYTAACWNLLTQGREYHGLERLTRRSMCGCGVRLGYPDHPG